MKYKKKIIILIFTLIICFIIYLILNKVNEYFDDKPLIKEPFIFCNVYGGIGNQLFQIFNCISLSLNTNRNYYFPLKNNDKRGLYWDNLFMKIKNNTIDESSINDKEIININENNFQYESLNGIEDGKNIKLNGYFQSYKYFADNYDKIIKILGINELQKQIKNNYYDKIKNKFEEKQITSIHFRFGDYVNIQSAHYVQTGQYFINSIENLLKINDKLDTYLYFGEENDNYKIKEILNEIENKISKNITLINYRDFIKDTKLNDWEEMLLMSCCDNNIIANSTFSWWSAYFNSNSNKIICYPSIWFGPDLQYHNTKDLFPESWNKINSSSNITCVSGYWKVKNKYNDKDNDKYKEWFKNTLKINAPYVIFGNEETINEFKKIRGNLPSRYVNLDIKDFYTSSLNINNNTHPVHVPSKELGLIWLEKINLMNKAKELNYFDTDWYCWIDAGINVYRDNQPPNQIWFNIEKENLLDKDKINYCEAINGSYENKTQIKDLNNWSYYHEIGAGIVIIHKSKISFYKNIFYDFLKKCINSTDNYCCLSEQVILTKILIKHPEYFHKICSGYGCILPNLY